MMRINRLFTILVLVALILSACQPIQRPATGTIDKLDDTTITKIETILTQTMQKVNVPGYAMCVVKDGQVVYNKGFGVTQLGGDQPVTPQSVFAIYSTTKSFTAVALMQLVEQGKVDLDGPITKYLPYFTMADPGYKQITVRMLASHTSGLIDDEIFANLPPKSEEPAAIGAAIEWFVRALADDKLTAAPPTVWQYAGTNFILLGDIIGKVSGEPYDVYITKHLLEPLGMTHSTLNPATIPADTLVGEHITADGVVTATLPSDFSGFETPEAGIHSTCEDMTRWMQVHLNHGELEGVRILQAESYDSLWQREASTGMEEAFGTWIEGYGLGWTVAEDSGHFLAGHPGGGAGQTSAYQLAPNDNLGVTVLANWGMDDNFPAWTAAANVLYALLGIESATAPNLEVFVKGAPVRLAVGLAVGPDDNLYVGSQWTRELVVLNPDTGEIIKRYGPSDGVDIPCDLAFGPDGSLYASMYPGFEGDGVMRMTPDGKVTGTPIPPMIWPVMTTKDGRLFAGLLLENDMIVELDPDFKAPPREVIHNGNFIHLREGPDGLIYALKWFDGEIIRFDPDKPEAVETVATGLTLPFNLAFDSKGQLYLIIGVDDATDAVARLDLTTGKPEILATMHNMLYGLAIDSQDRIFVSNASDGTIFEVLPTGDIRIVSPGGMILPSDVAIIDRPDGASLFLADWLAWREYDIATGELRSFRHGTWWPGTLTNPDTITAFGDKLLVASTENQQIQLWDPVQQKEALLISDPGVDNAIGFNAAIVAANYERKDVVSIDPANPDQRAVLAEGLAYPLGLATDGSNLYVGDFLRGQILQIAADGVKLDPPKVIAEGLQGPEGMALTGDGRLLVVESGANRLSIVDLVSGQVSTLLPELGLLRDLPRSRPQHYFFNGVDIDSSGMVYVTADGPNVIYRLALPPK